MKQTEKIIRTLAINLLVFVVLLECAVRLVPFFLPNGYLRELILFSARQSHSNTRVCHNLLEFIVFPHAVHRITLPSKEKKDLLFVGDSFTFGAFVKGDETFPSRVEAATGKRVANLGVGGTGPQVYNRMVEAGMRYDPDTVLYCVTDTDFYEVLSFFPYFKNQKPLSLSHTYTRLPMDGYFFTETMTSMQKAVALVKQVTNFSRAHLLVRQLVDLASFPFRDLLVPLVPMQVDKQTLYVPPRLVEHFMSSDRKTGVELTVALVEQACRFIHDQEKSFVVVLIPPREVVYGQWCGASGPLPDPYGEFKTRLLEKRIPFFDATPAIMKRSGKNGLPLLYFSIDGHLNEFGHKALADGLAQWLNERPLL